MGHEKWQPTKRLTWYQIDHLKTLRRTQPEEWNVAKLATSFGISVPAVSRILRSKFEPSDKIKERQDAMATEQTRKRRGEFLKRLGKQEEVQVNDIDLETYDTTEMENLDDVDNPSSQDKLL